MTPARARHGRSRKSSVGLSIPNVADHPIRWTPRHVPPWNRLVKGESFPDGARVDAVGEENHESRSPVRNDSRGCPHRQIPRAGAIAGGGRRPARISKRFTSLRESRG